MITTAGLARFIQHTPGTAVTGDDVRAIERSCLDLAGAAVAGLRDPVTRLVDRHLRDRGGRAEAQPLGHRRRAAAPDAAMLGATAARVLDLDDVGAFGAASATLLPAVLALAEWSGHLDGRSAVEAYAIGYTVGAALAAGYRPDERGFDATGAFGVLAATAAGARLLRLDLPETRHALGIAASRAGGLGCNTTSGAGVLHSGQAAAAAVQAVRLARRGVTAAPDAVEQRRGLREALSGPGAAPGDPPTVPAVGGTLALRRYPCHQEAHSAVAALLELREAYRLTVDDVAEVRVGGLPPGSAVLRDLEPAGGRAARASVRFLLATALCRGQVDLAGLTDEAVGDPAVARAVERIWLDVLPYWDRRAGPSGTHHGNPVQVTLTDGRQLERTVPPGSIPGAPGCPLPEGELEDRFRTRVGAVLPPDAVERAVTGWLRIGTVPDLRDSLRALVPERT